MQTTGVTAEQLADMMAAFMATAMKGSQTQVFHVVEELELSMTQFKILHILDGVDRELTPSELAQFVGLSPAATGRAVDALVRAGLVTRRDDDADRRVKRLTLTPTGTTAVDRITQARLEALANTVSTLDADQRDALAAALAPLLPDSPDGVCGSKPRTQEAPPA
ncbi:MarR family winged helix-turn-helix transcriptional regulator [Conexibacter woesei]|uniref:MarR family winged helix-turn-helix transcriptional regulator n=1 Tax=Conexibacter woesei TaxID=191495 RepID=UPI00040B3A5A|nr:MarR family transcriptional regulator [Conexibacter woesei]